MSEVVELEEISICPECGSRLFEIVETVSSNGPYCRCSQCEWHQPLTPRSSPTHSS